MKKILFGIFIALVLMTPLYADSNASMFNYMESDEVYINPFGLSSSSANMTREFTVNPFARVFSFIIRVVIWIIGGASVLIFTAIDFVNAAKNIDEDPNGYKKAAMKFIIRLVLYSAAVGFTYVFLKGILN